MNFIKKILSNKVDAKVEKPNLVEQYQLADQNISTEHIILDSASLSPINLTVACLVLMGIIKIIQSTKLKFETL